MTSSVEEHHTEVLKPDPVAAVLAHDHGAAPPETVILIGIPAPSSPGNFKLFRDIRMIWAVEGKLAAIRASKVIPELQVPLGMKCVVLWVDGEAELTHTCAGRSRAVFESFNPVDAAANGDVPLFDFFLRPWASQFGTT